MYFKILRVEGTSQVVFKRPVNHPGAYRPAWLAVQSQGSGHIISVLPRLAHWSSEASPNIYSWYLLGRALSVVLQVPCLGCQELNPGLLHTKHAFHSLALYFYIFSMKWMSYLYLLKCYFSKSNQSCFPSGPFGVHPWTPFEGELNSLSLFPPFLCLFYFALPTDDVK